MSELVIHGHVTARANVNIALVKYWGKAPAGDAATANLPAVPSLSLTLADLWTETTARFAPERAVDRFTLDGREVTGEAHRRVVAMLDLIRARADVASAFEIESTNHVPTAAGLASSASGMAALAAAAGRCAGLGDELEALSALARTGSGSASRSVFGGWVAWDGPAARQVATAEHWDLAVIIAVIGTDKKGISSRDAMNRTARTSPYYPAWVAQARGTFVEAIEAVEARDFQRLAAAMERSTWRMHASAMAADPAVFYWQPASVAVIRAVEELRDGGVPCAFTLDAGPNVKVFTPREHAAEVRSRLTAVAGVTHTIETGPGEGVVIQTMEDP